MLADNIDLGFHTAASDRALANRDWYSNMQRMEDRLGIGPYHYHSNCCRQDAQQHVLINCAAHFFPFL